MIAEGIVGKHLVVVGQRRDKVVEDVLLLRACDL